MEQAVTQSVSRDGVEDERQFWFCSQGTSGRHALDARGRDLLFATFAGPQTQVAFEPANDSVTQPRAHFWRTTQRIKISARPSGWTVCFYFVVRARNRP